MQLGGYAMLTRKDVEDALGYMDQHGLIRLSKPIGNWYQLHCPFHNNGQEKKPSCGCSLVEEMRNGKLNEPGTFHCFSCGAVYPMSRAIPEILKLKDTTLEAHSFLEQFISPTFNSNQDALIPDVMMSSVMAKYALEDLRLRTLAKHEYISEEELASYRYTVPYMYERKLTDAVIEKYDVGYDANHIPENRKKPLPCVTFPVKDRNGNTLFICRRSIEGKYFNLPSGIEKSVYGIYELPPDAKEVIVCESIFNALTCVVYGFNAVALLGTGTPHEMDQLRKLGVQSYVLCLDNDDAGRRGTERAKKALSKSAMVWTMTVPEGKDVNDLTKEEFLKVYNARN